MSDWITLENGHPRELQLVVDKGINPDQDGNDGEMGLMKNAWNRFDEI